jgi:sulfopyruvate decarboxylase subunit beta
MKRYDVLKEIVNTLNKELVVCNLGIPSRELYHLKDRKENFYMLGSMGLTSSIALGLAISQPKRKVYCIDGDGSLLMNLGSLSTIASINPANLTLIVIDNGTYGSTGNQKTHTSGRTDLALIAKGAGFESIIVITNKNDIKVKLGNQGPGCNFILIKTNPGNANVNIIKLDPEKMKERFMQSMNRPLRN